MTKQVILSSLGLKNITISNDFNSNFSFIFGEQKIEMNNLFAEFISPIVSQVRLTDPTFHEILFQIPKSSIITEEALSLFKSLSCGFQININEEQSQALKIISILIGNKELTKTLDEAFPISTEQIETHLEFYIKSIENSDNFNSTIIDFISSHFFSIDKQLLLTLPVNILYMIISNENLKLESEDSLLNFIEDICQKYSEDPDEKKYAILNDFYEQIEFTALCENKFNEFINQYDPNFITKSIWSKMIKCFYSNYKLSKSQINNLRYNSQFDSTNIKYSENPNDQLKGIIFKLTEQCGGNVHDKGVVEISSSTKLRDLYLPKYAADLNDNNFFHSGLEASAWILYDFKDRKVCPTHYSIKNNSDSNSCPTSWLIEGSNTGNVNDWVLLDAQHNSSMFLPSNSICYTFSIGVENKNYFRFLRMRSTGRNANGNYYLAFSSLEYYGLVTPKL